MVDQFLNLMDVLSKPATFADILFSSLPFWLAVLIGLVIGWCWKPRWTNLVCLGIRARLRYLWTFPPLFGAHRHCLAFTDFSALSLVTRLFSNFRLMTRRNSTQSPPYGDSTVCQIRPVSGYLSTMVDGTVTEDAIVNENDLEHFLHLVNGKGREMTWKNLMDRSTSNMAYQAWRHEPETGPMICRSRTIFEDATPELVRDFFWDDEFRPKWDHMLAYFKLVEECPRTGTTIVHWIKKFPFFCSDREYIIGRRIWEAGKTFCCVTKGVPYPDLMKRDNPRRVDKYFSSWVIRPVQSRKSDGQTACEVVLIRYEDMGIPKDVTKLGVRLRMWGTVKKLHDGFRAYQLARNSDAPLSRSALLARITTKISFQGNSASSETVSDDIEQFGGIDVERHRIDWKWVVIAGTVVIAGLHKGAIVKGLLFGAGQRFGRKRLAAQK